jgi:hypothetical protein
MESFTHVKSWLADAKEGTTKNAVICIVGNKCDLKGMRVVQSTEGAKLAQDNGMGLLII